MLFYIRKLLSYIKLFFIKGALSDRDIRKLLGYHIFIYPFDDKNLKPSSYNLTASPCAFIKEKNETQRLIVKDDTIVIPAGKTGIIETRESIYVSRWITGTYHSRVRLVNRGLGHIGTTLDACFFGVSAIALHNITEEDIDIRVGESIATIMFYSLTSRSDGIHDNMTARIDDNISLNVNAFYDYPQKDKSVTLVIKEEINKEIDDSYIKEKVQVIKDNTLEHNKSLLIYDIEKPVCENCNNCTSKETCSYSLLKNICDEESKRGKIVESIIKWRSQPWITSKEALIKQVEYEVKKNNRVKDIFIWSIVCILVAIGLIYLFSYLIYKEIYEELEGTFNSIITVIIPTAVIIIGMITTYYKNKYKGE